MKPRRVSGADRPVYRRPAALSPRRRRLVVPKVNWQLYLVGGGVLVVLVGWGQGFAINKISVHGQKSLSSGEVVSYVRQIQATNFWWGNLSTVDTAAMAAQLTAKHYQFKTVAITRQWPHGLDIMIDERTPSLLWRSGEATYLLDLDGTVMSPINPSSSKLPTVTDSTNLPVKAGQRVVSTRFVSFCVGLVEHLSQTTGISVTGLAVADTTTEITASTNKGYVVKFDTTRSVEDSLAELQRVLVQLATLKKSPAEYIDLRIENKAYYK